MKAIWKGLHPEIVLRLPGIDKIPQIAVLVYGVLFRERHDVPLQKHDTVHEAESIPSSFITADQGNTFTDTG